MRIDKKAQLGLTLLLGTVGIAAWAQVGCGGDGQYTVGFCSSCQENYTDADCKAWGERAGCTKAEMSTENSCDGVHTSCRFEGCMGSPICNDAGEAGCGSCTIEITQEICDAAAEEAGCASATTSMVTACGKQALSCDFVGCDYTPKCE